MLKKLLSEHDLEVFLIWPKLLLTNKETNRWIHFWAPQRPAPSCSATPKSHLCLNDQQKHDVLDPFKTRSWILWFQIDHDVCSCYHLFMSQCWKDHFLKKSHVWSFLSNPWKTDQTHPIEAYHKDSLLDHQEASDWASGHCKKVTSTKLPTQMWGVRQSLGLSTIDVEPNSKREGRPWPKIWNML